MSKLDSAITTLRARLAEHRRQREIARIRRELREIRTHRELGEERTQTLYRRLVALGEYVPGYMQENRVAPRFSEEQCRAAFESECA